MREEVINLMAQARPDSVIIEKMKIGFLAEPVDYLIVGNCELLAIKFFDEVTDPKTVLSKINYIQGHVNLAYFFANDDVYKDLEKKSPDFKRMELLGIIFKNSDVENGVFNRWGILETIKGRAPENALYILSQDELFKICQDKSINVSDMESYSGLNNAIKWKLSSEEIMITLCDKIKEKNYGISHERKM